MRLQVYPFPLSVGGWRPPGHVLPEGADPAAACDDQRSVPRRARRACYQASGGVTRAAGRDDDAVRRRRLLRTAATSSARSSTTRSCRRSAPAGGRTTSAGIAGTSTNVSQFTDFGETWYRGLLLSATRRFGASATLRVSYTWSTAEDNVSRFAGQVNDNGLGRNPADLTGLPLGFDPDSEKGPADTDQPHRLVVSGTWHGPWRLHALRHRRGGVRAFRSRRLPVWTSTATACRPPIARAQSRQTRRRPWDAIASGCRRRSRRTCGWRVRSGSASASR